MKEKAAGIMRTILSFAITIILFFYGMDAYSEGGYMQFFGIDLSKSGFIILMGAFLLWDILSLISLINTLKAQKANQGIRPYKIEKFGNASTTKDSTTELDFTTTKFGVTLFVYSKCTGLTGPNGEKTDTDAIIQQETKRFEKALSGEEPWQTRSEQLSGYSFNVCCKFGEKRGAAIYYLSDNVNFYIVTFDITYFKTQFESALDLTKQIMGSFKLTRLLKEQESA